MAAKTTEAKLFSQMEDAIMDRRFQSPIFGHLVATSDPEFQKHFIQMVAHAMELIAINYDHGNFSADNYLLVKFAAAVRDLVQSGDFSEESPDHRQMTIDV